MKFEVQPQAQGLRIQATATPDEARQLMNEFAKCADGSCSCQSSEYDKLQSMQVQATPAGLSVELQAKPGQALDPASIQACLQHTAAQIAAVPPQTPPSGQGA